MTLFNKYLALWRECQEGHKGKEGEETENKSVQIPEAYESSPSEKQVALDLHLNTNI